ncbi:peroxiredoxin [Paucilactobacillus suebicus]|uniref:thiol peroxidase n=1 Tax=Paucilactobacillus suebicus TaxID=152335 RepID=UPI0002490BBE|nr:peroxiredoxin [Paucilactobacillus suebicus]
MEITRRGQVETLVGNPPEVGEELPHFKVFNAEGQKVKTRDLLGKILLISVVPDINTRVCSIQTKKFNKTMDQYPDVKFITVSTNTTKQQAAWCAAEDVQQMEMMSDSEESFGYEMKLLVPNEGVLARSIFIVDGAGKIIYRQIVEEQTDEPNYLAAINALKKLI